MNYFIKSNFSMKVKEKCLFFMALFKCVLGMALILLEINRSQVFTTKCNEPQVVNSNLMVRENGVATPLSVRIET